MANNKIAGLIQWEAHKSRDGTTYDLKHLHPTDFEYELPESQRHPAVTVKVHVAFGLHTFTHRIRADDPPEDDYKDNRETRCFDYARYELSHQLPKIVRELPTRKIFFSRTLSGLINYATFDIGSGAVYAVFFDLMLYKTRGPNTLLLTVESAYEFEAGKRDTKEGRTSFSAIIGHALRGTKPKLPPRAR